MFYANAKYFVKCLSLTELKTHFKTSCPRTTQKLLELKTETFPEGEMLFLPSKKNLSSKISKETFAQTERRLCILFFNSCHIHSDLDNVYLIQMNLCSSLGKMNIFEKISNLHLIFSVLGQPINKEGIFFLRRS